MQVETDIQWGVIELYYDALKAMDVNSDSNSHADSPFEFDMIEEFREIK